jgi:hypothetical protein
MGARMTGSAMATGPTFMLIFYTIPWDAQMLVTIKAFVLRCNILPLPEQAGQAFASPDRLG